MEQLKAMKEALMGCAQGQIYGNLEQVDAKELGEVIDMIKDLAETEYYCSIVKAMEEGEEKERGGRYAAMYSPRSSMYHDPYRMPAELYDPRMRDMYRDMPMYAQGGGSGGSSGGSGGGNSSSGGSSSYARNGSGGNNGRGGGSRGYSEGWVPYEEMMPYPMYAPRDPREGRSGERRKMYMEGKGTKDKNKQMQELETYMQELSSDITEMIQDSTPEEKQMLQKKIITLANKIK